MASLKEVREALASTIGNNITTLTVYRHMPEVTQLPAAVIWPYSADFSGAMQRGMDTWEIRVPILVPRLDYETNQDSLDDFLTGSGPNSIRRVIYANASLGLADGTDAFVSGMTGYGGKFEVAQIQHTGAVLRITVRTPGV